MKKTMIIAIIATILALAAVKATALPRITMIDYNCGNTPEYIEKITEENNLTILNGKLPEELTKYIGHFNRGTFILEENGEKLLCSFYNGKCILGAKVESKTNE